MDPITLIVTALAAGAAAALQETAGQAITDAYQSLKRLIASRYPTLAKGVDYIEERPDRKSRQEDLQVDLAETAAAQDEELLTQAQAVLKAAQENPASLQTAGLIMEDVTIGASANIRDIIVQANTPGNIYGVKAKNLNVKGDFNVAGVQVTSGQAGPAAQSTPTPAAPPPTSLPIPVRILFLTANPTDTTRLRLDKEMREIDSALLRSRYRDRFDLIQHHAVRVTDLLGLLQRHTPDIVHFSGHGSDAGEIILEDEDGSMRPVSARALSTAFSLLRGNMRCVILNACFSQAQAAAIAQHIPCVIGMSTAITDTAAISFAAAFYEALGYGQNLQIAFGLGIAQIDLESLGEENTPQLLHPSANPAQIVFVSDQFPKV